MTDQYGDPQIDSRIRIQPEVPEGLISIHCPKCDAVIENLSVLTVFAYMQTAFDNVSEISREEIEWDAVKSQLQHKRGCPELSKWNVYKTEEQWERLIQVFEDLHGKIPRDEYQPMLFKEMEEEIKPTM
jgi:hypothetical protein